MPDGLAFVSVIAGFTLIAVAGARLGAGSATLAGLFPAQGTRDWPVGVQESDAPHFVLIGGQASTAPAPGATGRTAGPSSTVVEDLYAGPIR
jgi:hypothetical protein